MEDAAEVRRVIDEAVTHVSDDSRLSALAQAARDLHSQAPGSAERAYGNRGQVHRYNSRLSGILNEISRTRQALQGQLDGLRAMRDALDVILSRNYQLMATPPQGGAPESLNVFEDLVRAQRRLLAVHVVPASHPPVGQLLGELSPFHE